MTAPKKKAAGDGKRSASGKTQNILERLDISLPKGWGDLTSEQISRISYYRNVGGSATEYLVKLGLEFAGLIPNGIIVTDGGDIEYLYFKRGVGNLRLNAEHIARIAEALEWTTGEPEPMTAAPELKGYKTPDFELYGVDVEQLVTADVAFGHYADTKDRAALQMMVATLYLRGPFDPEKLESEAKRIGYLPTWQLEAVVLWFWGVKKLLERKYPHVYSGGAADGSPMSGNDLLQSILSGLNEGRVVDNAKIKRTEAHEALAELEQKIVISRKFSK